MTTVAEDEVLSVAELDLSVSEFAGMFAEPSAAAPETEAAIRITKGCPTDDEIAAVVAVLSATVTAIPPTVVAPVDRWGQPMDMHRGTSSFAPYVYPFVSRLRG